MVPACWPFFVVTSRAQGKAKRLLTESLNSKFDLYPGILIYMHFSYKTQEDDCNISMTEYIFNLRYLGMDLATHAGNTLFLELKRPRVIEAAEWKSQ